jgi:flagellar protein FliO/FliZ
MLDLDTLILAVAATLFVIAIGALLVWAFRTLFGGRLNPNGFLRPRDRRLGVVETASVDRRRKLVLIRRDDVEHLIITGGPVDMVVDRN